jgi:hypothetical protein
MKLPLVSKKMARRLFSRAPPSEKSEKTCDGLPPRRYGAGELSPFH